MSVFLVINSNLLTFGYIYIVLTKTPSCPVLFDLSGTVSQSRQTGCLPGVLLWFSGQVVSNSLQSNGLEHIRLPSPSPFPGVCSSSCPLHQWCCSTILSSVILLSSCFQSFLASGSFPMSWLFASGAQSIEASASATVGCSPQEYSRIKPNSPLLDCAFSLQWTATKSLFYFNEKKKKEEKRESGQHSGKTLCHGHCLDHREAIQWPDSGCPEL